MPSDKGEIVLGVDLDGVCTDFHAPMRETGRSSPPVELADGGSRNGIQTDVSIGCIAGRGVVQFCTEPYLWDQTHSGDRLPDRALRGWDAGAGV